MADTAGEKIDVAGWCKRLFTMAYEYIKTPEGSYICVHCNVVKKNQSTMHMHYKANHDGALKHKCKSCTYESSTKQTLDNHINARHPEQGQAVKEHSCPTCDFESLTKAGLRSHYLLRHLSKEVTKYLGKTADGIQCTGCGTGFASKPSYVYHLAGCINEEELSNDDKKGLGIA